MTMLRWTRADVLHDLEYPDHAGGRARALGQAGHALRANGLDPLPAFRAAAIALLEDGVRYAALVDVFSSADGDGDPLSDEQVKVVAVLARRQPGSLFSRILEQELDTLGHLAHTLVLDFVRHAGVDDGGHADHSSSVGRSEALTSSVGGAPGVPAPGAGVPTVGEPTDSAAEVPSASRVSVEAPGAAGEGPAAPGSRYVDELEDVARAERQRRVFQLERAHATWLLGVQPPLGPTFWEFLASEGWRLT